MMERATAKVAALLSVFGAITGWQPLRAAQNEGDLKIVILSGDGLTNNLKKRVSTTPIVEVRDRNNKPVAGATVAFLLPANGPSATFANGSRLLTAVTGPNGQAAASAMQANSVAGSFQINVTASFQGQVATTGIAQTNAAAAAGGIAGIGTAATIGIVGAAAAAVAAAVRLTAGNDSGKKTKVGIGTPTIQ